MPTPPDTTIPLPFPIEFMAVPQFAFYKGRDRWVPDMIVIHIAEGMRESIFNTFKNAAQPKSSHFLCNQDGSMWQFVATTDTAFGNGVVINPTSSLVTQRQALPDSNPNLYTISIEHEGFSNEDINESQYQSTAKLVWFLSRKWKIKLDAEHIIPHHQIDAAKSCPGMISVEKIISMALSLSDLSCVDN